MLSREILIVPTDHFRSTNSLFGSKEKMITTIIPSLLDMEMDNMKSYQNLSDYILQYFRNPNVLFGKSLKILITGDQSAGKSVLAAKLALNQCVRYTRYYDPYILMDKTDHGKAMFIKDKYDDCMKAENAIIIIDDYDKMVGRNGSYVYDALHAICARSISNRVVMIITTRCTEGTERLGIDKYTSVNL
jgi:AAA+ superfamily predicted ATPase